MKILITLATLLLLIGTASAGMGVGAAGISYDRIAGNPGFHIMAGAQFEVDKELEASVWTLYAKRIEGRMLTTKFNYGQIELDQVQFEFIYYYDWIRPIWNLQLGFHASGTYEMTDGHVGFITGGELRKDISDKFGLFLSGDVLFTDEAPFDLFFITFGVMANFL